MAKYIKFRCCKRSIFTRPQVQGYKLLGGAFGVNIRKDIRIISFKENCSYTGSSNDEINVLFGYTLGKDSSVCIGWRYLSVSKSIEIIAAHTINGLYNERFLMSADYNKAYIMSLEINWEKAQFEVTCETALERGYKLHIIIHTGGMGEDSGALFLSNWCFSKGLAPTIGKILSRPENVMEVRVERI